MRNVQKKSLSLRIQLASLCIVADLVLGYAGGYYMSVAFLLFPILIGGALLPRIVSEPWDKVFPHMLPIFLGWVLGISSGQYDFGNKLVAVIMLFAWITSGAMVYITQRYWSRVKTPQARRNMVA